MVNLHIMVSALMLAKHDLKIEIDSFLLQKFITSFIRHAEGYNVYNHFLQTFLKTWKPWFSDLLILGPMWAGFQGQGFERDDDLANHG